MKKVTQRLSKIEKLLLILNIIFCVALLFYLIAPNLFLQEYGTILIRGLATQVILFVNLLFVIYWLVRTRYYFLISILYSLLYLITIEHQVGWDAFYEAGLKLIIVPADGSVDKSQHDYIGKKIELPDHPRLILMKNEEDFLKKAISSDSDWKKINKIILDGTQVILAQNLKINRIKGNQYIANPQECFRRLFFLSYLWRITKRQEYFDAAKNDLLMVASVKDWQTSNYINTAEITIGVSIAYDWIFDNLSEIDRLLIQKAIISKGLEPSMNSFYNNWLDETTVRNQICNTAMIYGALAIYENNSKLAKQILNRSIGSLSYGMTLYNANAAHPAGYIYGSYGTSFNAMAIDVLQKLFGKDFDLLQIKGFVNSGLYFQNMIGSTNQPFNYSDGEPYLEMKPNPLFFWLSDKAKDPTLLWKAFDILRHGTYKDFVYNRLLPAIIIWGVKLQQKELTPPSEKMWVVNDKNALALMRTSWSDNAIFVGFKAGSPITSYGHMDVGSFVLDADNERWAIELGGDNLSRIEAKGVNVLDMTQNSKRWEIFRNNNKSHNTLTVNNEYQKVTAYANIIRSSENDAFMYTISDMSSVYEKSLLKAHRGIAIVDKKYVQVRDEIETLPRENTIRWQILTAANVKIISNNLAELIQNDKKFYLKVLEPLQTKLQTWSANPSYSYETRNPGKNLVGFNIKNNKRDKVVITVILSNDKKKIMSIQKITPLKDW